MQEEYNKRPMVDVLSKQIGRIVVMSGNQYVYMDTKASLEVTELEVANKTLADEETSWNNKNFRNTRDNLLTNVVDFYQKPLVWENLTSEQQEKVRVYRKELLECTDTWELPDDLNLEENLINTIEALIEQTFSKTAKEWGYISIERAISYQGSTNSVWHNEATTFRKWRDDVVTYFLNSYYVSEMVLKDILPTKEEFLLNIPKIGE